MDAWETAFSDPKRTIVLGAARAAPLYIFMGRLNCSVYNVWPPVLLPRFACHRD